MTIFFGKYDCYSSTQFSMSTLQSHKLFTFDLSTWLRYNY